MRLTLDYGRDGLAVDLPDANVRHVLDLTPAPPLPDPVAAVQRALAQPIGTAPLATLARGKRDACLLVCDITRPVPNPLVLEAILPVLASAGLPPERVTILVATGTHRPSTDDEKREMLGERVLASGVRVVDHVCTDPNTHRFLQTTPGGVPVALDTRWLDAGLRLSLGLIEPHLMAGYSGGRKLIMPGIAALESVQVWHSPRFLEHPHAANGIVEGNPVHAENSYIARLCPADFICDVTLDGDRRVTGVFAGAMEDAWQAGVAFVAAQVRAPIPEPVDIALVSAGGYPLDTTFYQAVKGMVAAVPIVKPGGTVILAASLTEGIGGPHFAQMLHETADLNALVAAMQAPDWKFRPDQWQIEVLAKAARNHRIVVVSDGLSLDVLATCHVTPAPSVDAALADALARHGRDATIAVIPKGPYVIACLA